MNEKEVDLQQETSRFPSSERVMRNIHVSKKFFGLAQKWVGEGKKRPVTRNANPEYFCGVFTIKALGEEVLYMYFRRSCLFSGFFLLLFLSVFLLLSCHKDDGIIEGPSLTMRESVTGEYDRMERASVLTDVYRPDEYYYFEDDNLFASLPYYNEDTGHMTVFVVHEDSVPLKDENGTPVYTSDGTLFVQHYTVTTVRTLLPDGESVSFVDLPMADDHNFIRGGIAENGIWYLSFPSTDDKTVFHVMERDGSGYKNIDADALFAGSKTRGELNQMSAMFGNDGTIYVSAGTELSVLSKDFEWQYSTVAEEEIQSLWMTSDGAILFLTGQIPSQKVMKLDEESRATILYEDLSDFLGRVIQGIGADYYLQEEVGVWKVEKGERKLVLNQYNSALSPGTFLIGVLSSEVFAAVETDTEHNKGITLYRHAEDILLSEVQVIEVADAMLNADSAIYVKMAEFNRLHPEYYIILTDTVDENADYASRFDRLCFNIGNGFYKPDIILTDANTKVVDTVLARSLFQDLTTFMREDSYIKLNDLFGAVRSYFSDRKGGLWGICPSFTVTTIVGRNDTLGRFAKQKSWTLEEELGFLESRSQGTVAFDRLTQETWVRFLLGPAGFNQWVDYKTGECNFDQENFTQLLRFVKTLPKDYSDYQNHVPFLAGLTDMEQINLVEPYRNGQIVLQTDYMQGMLGAWMTEYQFGTVGPNANASLSMIGYPSETGDDTIALNPSSVFIITPYCEDPNVAWELICSFFTGDSEYPIDSFTASSFSSLQSSFERSSEIFEKYYLIEKSDSATPYIWSQTLQTIPEKGVPASIDPYVRHIQIDTDFVKKTQELLNNMSCTAYIDYMPSALEEIIMEEISAYLKGGSNESACIRYIQSRAGIWLAEHQ